MTMVLVQVLGPYQWLVLDPLWLVGSRAEPTPPVGLILLIVALEPDHLTIPLEGEDMRCDPVEEPAVVRDDDGTTRKVQEGLLECAKGVDIEVVRWLIEEYQISARLEEFRQVHPVPLPTREDTDLLLLVCAAEVEPGAVGSRIDTEAAELEIGRASCREGVVQSRRGE